MSFDFKEGLILTANINLGYAQKLTADLTEEQMVAQPVAGKTMNHAAWVLGHLAYAANAATARITGKPNPASPEVLELLGNKSVPRQQRSKYASKAELLKSLEEAHATLAAALRAATDEQLSAPSPEPMNKRFPKVGDFVVFLMTSHQVLHLGQLSALRRAAGLPPVM
jgi:uncharacterized damage-inducible protein DinB